MSYFREVFERFGTEFWVNNPSGPEMQMALEAGAVGVTDNPRYIVALLKTEPEFVHTSIDEVLAQAGADEQDLQQLAVQVIQKTVSRPLKLFQSLYQESGGRYGQVAIQGNPYTNDDLKPMLKEAERFHKLGENIIIKFPSTVKGAEALEELTARGWSTIGTMSFSVAQYIYMAEAHRRGLQRTNKKPKCLITMLPGMFDEYLAEDAERRGVKVSDEVMSYAGISTAREAHKIYQERNYEAIVLSGGARSTAHWTELVGRSMAMTLSGKLAERLIKEHPPLVSRIQGSAPSSGIEELRQEFPDFVRACDADALVPEEFRQYGPFIRFQNAILDGLAILMKEIQSQTRKAASQDY